jgi:hypothetical protein
VKTSVRPAVVAARILLQHTLGADMVDDDDVVEAMAA